MPTSDPRSYIGAFNPKPPDTSAYDELSRGAVLQTLADRAAGRRNTATIAGQSGDVDRQIAGRLGETTERGRQDRITAASGIGVAGPNTLSDMDLLPNSLEDLRLETQGGRKADTLSTLANIGIGAPQDSVINIPGLGPETVQGLTQGANPLITAAELEFKAQHGRSVTITGPIGPDGLPVGGLRNQSVTTNYDFTAKGNQEFLGKLVQTIIAFVQKENPGANVGKNVDFTGIITVDGKQKVTVLVDGEPVTIDVDSRLFPR